MSTNVSSYNSAGCGGCGGAGGNSYPALARLFVNSIEPCITDGTINMNLGQVEINGSTDTTTIKDDLVVTGSITAGQFDVTNTSTTNLTVSGNITQTAGTTSLKATTVNGNLDASGNISCDQMEAVTCQIGDSTVNQFGYNALTDKFEFKNDSGDVLIIDPTTITCDNAVIAVVNSSSVNTSTLTATGGLTVDTNVLKVNATTNKVGINTTDPSEALEVTGNIKSSGIIYSPTLSCNLVQATTIYQGAGNADFLDGSVSMVNSTKRIGIGITNPTEKLDVVGNIKSSGAITAGAGLSGSTLYTTGTATIGTFILPAVTTYHQAILKVMGATPDSIPNNASTAIKNWTSGADYNSPTYSFSAATGLFTNNGSTRLVKIDFTVGFAANATGRRQVDISVDSVVYGRSGINTQSNTTSTYMNGTVVVLWPNTKTISINAFQDSGAALSLSVTSTHMSILFL